MMKMFLTVIAVMVMATQAWGAVEIHGQTFDKVPVTSAWGAGEEFYRVGNLRMVEFGNHNVEIWSLYTKCQDGGHCNPDGNNPGYLSMVDVVFIDGTFIGMGDVGYYGDIMAEANDELLVIWAMNGHWLKAYDKDFGLVVDKKYDMEYRLHARITDDGKSVLVKESSNFMKQAFLITSTGRHLQLPRMLVNQGECGGEANVSFPRVVEDFLTVDQVMYRVYYDSEKHVLYFGHTMSTNYHGFRRGIRTSSLESWDFNTGTHRVHFASHLVKIAWEVTSDGIVFWSPKMEGAFVKWEEYLEGNPTGRFVRSDNHMHPIFAGDTARMPVMVGNYDIMDVRDVPIRMRTANRTNAIPRAFISFSPDEARYLVLRTLLTGRPAGL